MYNVYRVLGSVLVMKKLMYVFVGIFLCMNMVVIPVEASTPQQLLTSSQTEEKVEKRNLFEEFYYRLVLKDTRDFFDYVLLGILIVGLLIVMVFQNTHYVVVKTSPSTFLEEEPVQIETIEVEKEETEEKVEENTPEKEKETPRKSRKKKSE